MKIKVFLMFMVVFSIGGSFLNSAKAQKKIVPKFDELTKDSYVITFLNKFVKTAYWDKDISNRNSLYTNRFDSTQFSSFDEMLQAFQKANLSWHNLGSWELKGINDDYDLYIQCANSNYSGGLPYIHISVYTKGELNKKTYQKYKEYKIHISLESVWMKLETFYPNGKFKNFKEVPIDEGLKTILRE